MENVDLSLFGSLMNEDAEGERLLDVALSEFIAHGFRRVSISDIASVGGVSRRTIHRRFGEKDNLVVAVVQREALRFFANQASMLADLGTPEERAIEAFVLGIRECRNHPLIEAVQKFEPETFVMVMTTSDALEKGRMAVALLLTHETLPFNQALWAADLMTRITSSLLIAPSQALAVETDELAREFAQRCFVPLIEAARTVSVTG